MQERKKDRGAVRGHACAHSPERARARRPSVRVATDIASLAAETWDRLANPDPATYDPFLSHAFLSALERSGSVAPEAGWSPCHLMVEDENGGLLAAMPCYLKTHSMGEYVFDQGWADAAERAGLAYYPKLQTAVPFTPVPGRRLLARAEADAGRAAELLLEAARSLATRLGASSWHATFLDAPTWDRLAAKGCLQRTGLQYHWHNRGYARFDDFLAALTSRKRKAIRRERRLALADGIRIEAKSGKDISEADWDAFYAFYMDTGSRKWGQPYLNRAFFSLLGESLGERVLLFLCHRAGRPIAGALNLIGGDALYGRYWGAIEHHDFLHFETCYYRAIEHAIALGLARVEAGAGGEHKIARGYEPVTTRSAHWIRDARLRRAIADYLARERRHVALEAALIDEETPFRRDRRPGSGSCPAKS